MKLSHIILKKVIYGTNSAYFELIKELCDDERLQLREGAGIEVKFDCDFL